MANYIVNYETNDTSDDELYHYGVLGMRWGVRRAGRKLSQATDSETREKAVKRLEKHKSKGSSKVSQLEKQRVKLDDKLRKATTVDKVKAGKIEAKATKLYSKAAKKKDKAYKWYTSSSKATKLLAESEIKKSES